MVFFYFFINFFHIRPKIVFVTILDVYIKIFKVRYSSRFLDLLFVGNITSIFFLKSLGIFPVEYILLIKQYTLRLVSSPIACSNSSGILSTQYSFFYFKSFHIFQILHTYFSSCMSVQPYIMLY